MVTLWLKIRRFRHVDTGLVVEDVCHIVEFVSIIRACYRNYLTAVVVAVCDFLAVRVGYPLHTTEIVRAVFHNSSFCRIVAVQVGRKRSCFFCQFAKPSANQILSFSGIFRLLSQAGALFVVLRLVRSSLLTLLR